MYRKYKRIYSKLLELMNEFEKVLTIRKIHKLDYINI